MKPIETKHTNAVYGKNQEEYQQLPAHRDQAGTVTTCWEISELELKEIIKNKKIYLQQHTFNEPMQPVRISVEDPISKIK